MVSLCVCNRLISIGPAVKICPAVHIRQILPRLSDISGMDQCFFQMIGPVYIHVMSPGEERCFHLVQPLAEAVSHVSGRTVKAGGSHANTYGSQQRMNQFILDEMLASFNPPQWRINFAWIQFNKVKKTALKTGAPTEMDVGSKAAGRIAIRCQFFNR